MMVFARFAPWWRFKDHSFGSGYSHGSAADERHQTGVEATS
jgi:hypothetical protein